MSGTVKRKPAASVRIIGGRWKGRRISVSREGVRPTGDRVRETLFNWLAPYIRGLRCLDLFAGSGALGIEALSRGAGRAVFAEKSRPIAAALTRTLAELGADNAKVHCTDAMSLLESVSESFDLVFLDPPFDGPSLQDLCTLLENSGALAESALIYMESDKRSAPPQLPPNWRPEKEKTAGNVRYALARRTNALTK